MRTLLRIKLLSLLLLTATPAYGAPLSFPFHADDSGKIIVTVKVNGQPMEMLLDTGATITVFRHRIGTAGGTTPMQGAVGQTVLVTTCTNLIEGYYMRTVCGAKLPGTVAGLLGYDFLSQFSTATFDMKHHVVRFDP